MKTFVRVCGIVYMIATPCLAQDESNEIKLVPLIPFFTPLLSDNDFSGLSSSQIDALFELIYDVRPHIVNQTAADDGTVTRFQGSNDLGESLYWAINPSDTATDVHYTSGYTFNIPAQSMGISFQYFNRDFAVNDLPGVALVDGALSHVVLPLNTPSESLGGADTVHYAWSKGNIFIDQSGIVLGGVSRIAGTLGDDVFDFKELTTSLSHAIYVDGKTGNDAIYGPENYSLVNWEVAASTSEDNQFANTISVDDKVLVRFKNIDALYGGSSTDRMNFTNPCINHTWNIYGNNVHISSGSELESSENIASEDAEPSECGENTNRSLNVFADGSVYLDGSLDVSGETTSMDAIQPLEGSDAGVVLTANLDITNTWVISTGEINTASGSSDVTLADEFLGTPISEWVITDVNSEIPTDDSVNGESEASTSESDTTPNLAGESEPSASNPTGASSGGGSQSPNFIVFLMMLGLARRSCCKAMSL